MNLAWYIKRLQVMGFRETLHRVYEQGVLVWLRFNHNRQNVSVPDDQKFQFCVGTQSQLPDLDWDIDANRANSESLLQGCWPALGYSWRWQTAQDWHRAPDSGKNWPVAFFGAIPYRAGNPFGDIRVTWEPSRLQQLVSLALLAREESTRTATVDLFQQQLVSWAEANPPYSGVHYVSAMECGLRLIAVCHAVDIIRPYLQSPQAIWPVLIRLVESHAALIVKRLSLYSSAGNHTLAEAAGLVYAGYLFPEFREADKWKATGVELFGKESKRQFLNDGGGLEQAFGYHLLITDLVNLVRGLLKKCGESTAELDVIAERAQDFLSCFWDDSYQLPNIGDWDNGFAISPYLSISKNRTPWAGKKVFFQSGYSVIRPSDNKKALWIMDHGPLGMAPSFGHGHSDCLSVYLRLKNTPILVDNGTYTYTGDLAWRKYFRSTRAHNAVTINNHDQAIQETAFMWSSPFNCEIVDVAAGVADWSIVLAFHTGYENIGIRHYRALCISEKGSSLVWDYLVPVKERGVENLTASLWWQLGPEVEIAKQEGGLYSLSAGIVGDLTMNITGGDMHNWKGKENPKVGWYSPVYGQKEPIHTIEARYFGKFPHEFCTYIKVPDSGYSETSDLLKEKLREICDATSSSY